MESLFAYHGNLLSQVEGGFFRYQYPHINWNQRMIGIKGPRGTGKTTMILQHIKFGLNNPKDALYVTADHPWFYTHSILELVEEFVKFGGRTLFIDEVHKYPQWSRELKAAYDGNPNLRIVFTASSALDIYRGEADLSRRVVQYELAGLSFREFLGMSHGHAFPSVTLDHLLENHTELAQQVTAKFHPLPLFKEYIRSGYYPYRAESGESEYFMKLNQTLNAVIESDLAATEGYAAGSAVKLKRLLGVIAESVPFQPNISALSRKLDTSRDTVYAYLNSLRNARVLNFLSSEGKGVSTLQKPDKIYLENTNLSHAMRTAPDVGSLRETFFLNQMVNAGKAVHLPEKGDFLVDGRYTLEVGGKGKTAKQLESLSDAFVVRDDLEIGFGNKIPLWVFGFLY
jgi:uncharacterized protein